MKQMVPSEILEALRVESQARAKRQRIYRAFIIFCVAIPLLTLSMGLLGSLAHLGPFANKPFDWTGLLSSFGVVGLLGSYVGASAKQKELTKEAAMLLEPKAVPFLVEALGAGDASVAEVAKAALTLTLPRLTAEQMADIAIEWKEIFIHTGSKDVDLQMCAVEALRNLGTKQELAYLDAMGKGQLPAAIGNVPEKVRVTALSASADLRMRLAKAAIDQRSDEAAQAQKALGLE